MPDEPHTVEREYTLKVRNTFFDNYESWYGVFDHGLGDYAVSVAVLDALMFGIRTVMTDYAYAASSAVIVTGTSMHLERTVPVIVTRVSATVVDQDAYDRYRLMRSTERL